MSYNLQRTDIFWIKHVRVRHVSVSDINTTLMITLNYVIFLNYYLCRRANVRVVSGVCVVSVLYRL
jgi:hypothetical protein